MNLRKTMICNYIPNSLICLVNQKEAFVKQDRIEENIVTLYSKKLEFYRTILPSYTDSG